MSVPQNLGSLTASEARWLDYIDRAVVSRLPGSPAERARTAAIVTWWALKEGVLDTPSPLRHSLCGTGGDHPIGDLEVCPGAAWQVGLSGIQPNSISDAQAFAAAAQVYPAVDLPTVLRRTAEAAGVDGAAASAIASSTGLLRRAWLLRDPAIAFVLQRPFVEAQCLRGSASWCYGGWQSARAFASSRGRIDAVVGALESHFLGAQGGSRSRVAVIGLAAAALGLWYLYSTPKGIALRTRAERSVESGLSSLRLT